MIEQCDQDKRRAIHRAMRKTLGILAHGHGGITSITSPVGTTRIGHSRAAANTSFDLDCAGSPPGSVITFGDNHLLSVNGSCASSAAPF